MSKITAITHKPDRERYWIYLDGQYCTSIRERTFPAMNLSVGQAISGAEIMDLEKFHWKHVYGETAWEKEKVRLNKTKTLLEAIDSRVDVSIVGFGADTTQLIKEHPEEQGKPDIEVRLKHKTPLIMSVEVTGTERMRGDTFWVRLDKIEYIKAHLQENIWLVLHYQLPEEQFVFIKVDPNKQYRVSEKVIGKSTERYVEFTKKCSEVKQLNELKADLMDNIERISHFN